MVSLSRTVAQRDPALPFITYYHDAADQAGAAQRVELSTTSFANWVAKTANYLADEHLLGEGDVVVICSQLHWVVPIWLAATRKVGATTIVVESPSELARFQDAHLWLVDGPSVLQLNREEFSGEVAACSMHPLALPFPEALPTGVADFFADVRIHGDYFADRGNTPWRLQLPGLTEPIPDVATAELTALRIAENSLTNGDRLLINAGTQDPWIACFDLPAALAGSVVITTSRSPQRIAEIAETERVTAILARHIPA